MNTKIRQVYFSSAQMGFLDPMWTPYRNEVLTPCFENEVFKTLYLEEDYKDSDYYGVFSYKFNNKHHKDGRTIERMMIQDNYESDVYSFFRGKQDSGKPNTFFDTYHPHLLEIGVEIIKRLFNEDLTKIKADRIYYNHWVAKSELFKDYCKEMLLPAMELLDGDLKELVWKDATYKAFRNISGEVAGIMSPERCMEVFGVSYYTHHAFILERLPSIYFAIRESKIKQL